MKRNTLFQILGMATLSLAIFVISTNIASALPTSTPKCVVASFCNKSGKKVDTMCGCGVPAVGTGWASPGWVDQKDGCYHKSTNTTCTYTAPVKQCANDWNKQTGGKWDGDGAGTKCGCDYFSKYGQSPFSPSPGAQCYPPRPYAVDPTPTPRPTPRPTPKPITPAPAGDITPPVATTTVLQPNDCVKIKKALYVRRDGVSPSPLVTSTPNPQPRGATGILISRSTSKIAGYWRWNIDYTTGPDGWSTEGFGSTKYLEKISCGTTATTTVADDRPCIGIALNRLTGDNGWLGFAGVELAEKKKITYCATLTRQASYISFKAYDITDRKCGSADIRVRQVGNTGWSKNSGFASSPIVNAAGTRWSGNPAWTAAGVYEVILELGPGSPGCTRFDIAWRATGSGGI